MSDHDLIRRGDALAEIRRIFNGYPNWVTDAIAALPAVTVRVKPLVWDGWDGGLTSADTPFGKYILGADLRLSFPTGRYDRYELEGTAKAAAQADYEARILAALEPVTAPAMPVTSQPIRVCPICDIADCAAHRPVTPDPAAIREAALREAAKQVTELMARKVKRAVGDGYNLGLGTAYEAILALIPKGADHDRA